MKKYIIQKIKDLIELKSLDWAHNYVVSKNPELQDSPKGKVEIESANHRMAAIEKEIEFLNALLKSESKAA